MRQLERRVNACEVKYACAVQQLNEQGCTQQAQRGASEGGRAEAALKTVRTGAPVDATELAPHPLP